MAAAGTWWRAALTTCVLCTASFIVIFDGIVVAVALPTIQRSFELTALGGQWVLTAYLVPLGGFLLLGGRLGDRFGRRRVLVAGLVVLAAGLAGAGIAPSWWLFTAMRVVQGIGAALALPNVFALIGSMPDARRRHRLMAAVSVAGSSASASGALVGGWLTEHLGWRAVFAIGVPLAVAAAIGARWYVARGDDHERPRRVGALPAALATSGIALLVFAITAGSVAVVVVALACSAALLTAFVAYERTGRGRLLAPGLLRSRSLRTAVAGIPAVMFAYNGTIYLALLAFQSVAGYSASEAGLAILPLSLAATLGGPAATRLLRRFDWSVIAAGAMAAACIALGVLGMVTVRGPYLTGLLPGLVLFGFAVAVSAVTFNVGAGKDAAHRDKGVAYGLYGTASHVSAALTVAVLAVVSHAAGFRMAFLLCASVSLLGGVAVFALGRAGRFVEPTSGTTR